LFSTLITFVTSTVTNMATMRSLFRLHPQIECTQNLYLDHCLLKCEVMGSGRPHTGTEVSDKAPVSICVLGHQTHGVTSQQLAICTGRALRTSSIAVREQNNNSNNKYGDPRPSAFRAADPALSAHTFGPSSAAATLHTPSMLAASPSLPCPRDLTSAAPPLRTSQPLLEGVPNYLCAETGISRKVLHELW
jgi:hypothetical protein